MKYSEYLRSEHWRAIKIRRLRVDGYKCAVCSSREKLNVHHKTYETLGHENVKRDIVTLCHRCHACLHRIQNQTAKDYEILKKSKLKLILFCRLRKKVTELLLVEIWIRDRANGGDKIIFEAGQIDQLCKIIKLLYPRLSPARHKIKKLLRIMWTAKVCETYNRNHSQPRTAKAMCVDSVDEILNEHGFGKIK